MPLTAQAAPPRFETHAPNLELSGGRLGIALPVFNTGGSTATQMTLTSITLASAARVEPALPFVLGDLAAGNSFFVSTIFAAAGIAPGARLLLTVRGTYRAAGQTLAYTLNRVITVPAAVPPGSELLVARVQATVGPPVRTYSYALINEEPVGSPRYVNAVSLDMVRPFTVTGTPPGWAVDTDGLTYVSWYASDTALPYAHHVAPGASLTGFQISATSGAPSSEGRPFSLTSWNHTTDSADRVAFGTTLVPARI